MVIKHFVCGALATNCYLAADENTKKAFIVDPAAFSSNLKKEVEAGGYQVEYIILTHGHGDHIGGVEDYLKLYPKAKLVANELEIPILSNPQLNMSRETCSKACAFTADIYVQDGDTLKVGDMELRFLTTPGHTPGGMCIYNEAAQVVFSGDTLFAQAIGRTDFPGGSFNEIKNSIHKKLFTLPENTTVLPGHMGSTTIGHEKELNPFV